MKAALTMARSSFSPLSHCMLRLVLACSTSVLLAVSPLSVSAQQAAPSAPTPEHAHRGEAGSAAAAEHSQHSHARADIERHRGMAAAHSAAAQCLAAGKSHDSCQKQLQIDCKGLALGKYCGMRHAH